MQDQESQNKKAKLDGQWKERYFAAFETMEQARLESDSRSSSLKQYNILLQNIQLEKSLGTVDHKFFQNFIQNEHLWIGLDLNGIAELRSSVDPNLNKYPTCIEENFAAIHRTEADE